MRKSIVVILFMLGAGMLHAQNKKFASGIKAGVNLANLRLDNQPDVNSDMRINFHAGIWYNIPFSKNFSLNPEILFSAEGANQESNISTNDIILNYLQIPIMLQLNTSSGFFLETGPALSILAKGQETIKTSAATSELALNKQIKKTNLSWGAGLGYRMKKLGFYGRYNLGLSNLAKNDTRPETKSSVIQVGLSWGFTQ
ncbi:MAG: porin family protein [Flavisolibacter sp.]